MSTDSQLALGTDAQRYEALLRFFEALSACPEPEDLSRVLADQLRELISFDYIDVLVFKENSNEVEWRVITEFQNVRADLPIEETVSWHVYRAQEALHIVDWGADTNFPRLKQLLENRGDKPGSVICVPLTTAHRRLGTLGIASQAPNAYCSEDISFLQLLARGVALAIDDALNLRKSRAARLELEGQNVLSRERQLLLVLPELPVLAILDERLRPGPIRIAIPLPDELVDKAFPAAMR